MRAKTLRTICKMLSKNRSKWRREMRSATKKAGTKYRALQILKARDLIWRYWWIKYRHGER